MSQNGQTHFKNLAAVLKFSRKMVDKVNLENILVASKAIKNFFLHFFNDWFTFFSIHHSYKTSSSTNGKCFIHPMESFFISSAIKSWNIVQHKKGSLKTLGSAKIKLLITNIYLKDYLAILTRFFIISCLQGDVPPCS